MSKEVERVRTDDETADEGPVEDTPRQDRVRGEEPLIDRERDEQHTANHEHRNQRSYSPTQVSASYFHSSTLIER